jgi:hypothetical protein
MALRLRLVWLGLVATGIALVAADVTFFVVAGSASDAATPTCARRTIDDPYEVAARFLTGAVERRDPASAYMLATPSLRGRGTCADWARGRLPVAAFRHIDWDRAAYEPVAGGDGQIVLRVLLYRVGSTIPVPFLMELQTETREPGWHVGSFQRDRWLEDSVETPAA